jgi:hypothetical protein
LPANAAMESPMTRTSDSTQIFFNSSLLEPQT